MTAVIYNNKGEAIKMIRDIAHFKLIRLDDGKQVYRFFCHDKSKHTLKAGYGTFDLFEDIQKGSC